MQGLCLGLQGDVGWTPDSGPHGKSCEGREVVCTHQPPERRIRLLTAAVHTPGGTSAFSSLGYTPGSPLLAPTLESHRPRLEA